jgi:hypothetical protein
VAFPFLVALASFRSELAYALWEDPQDRLVVVLLALGDDLRGDRQDLLEALAGLDLLEAVSSSSFAFLQASFQETAFLVASLLDLPLLQASGALLPLACLACRDVPSKLHPEHQQHHQQESSHEGEGRSSWNKVLIRGLVHGQPRIVHKTAVRFLGAVFHGCAVFAQLANRASETHHSSRNNI